MIRYRKLRDLKSTMENIVVDDILVVTLFEGIPELQEFTFIRNQEYDDNNYYDNTRVASVNGHSYGYEGYEEDAECSESCRDPSTLPQIPENKVSWVEDVVGLVADKYDYGEEDITFKREDFKRENYVIHDGGTSKKKGHVSKERFAERKYFIAHLAGKKLPDSFFLKIDLKYALYYALDHGRFKSETEFRLFARRGEMENALEYARIIKCRLPEEVENFFILDASEDDQSKLQDYVREFMQASAAKAS
jgi:hypothetical protein